ncbi:MAG: HDOD domain-containing protein [bacterium]|nr:HDOD domain-containing protein [bacterium]
MLPREKVRIPGAPQVLRAILRLPQADRLGAAVEADLLGMDAPLAGSVVHLVNSGYYRLPCRVRDVKHAVAYLGRDEIRRAATIAAVMRTLAGQDPAERRAIWFHSVHAALASRRISDSFFAAVDVEQVQTWVLLHDVGKLVYLEVMPDSYRRIRVHRADRALTWSAAERELQLPSHALLGAMLCSRWSLPESVRNAAEFHEVESLRALNDDDDDPSTTDDLRVVCLANLCCNLATEDLGAEQRAEIREAILDALGMTEGTFLLLMGEIYELRSQVTGILHALSPVLSTSTSEAASSENSSSRGR